MATGVLKLLNHILSSCARLYQLLRRLLEVLEQRKVAPRRFDCNIMRSLKPPTVKTYQRQVRYFLAWLDDQERLGQGPYPNEPHEWDDALCAYLCPAAEEDRRPPCTRAQAENLLAGVEKARPRLKRELSYARALIADW